MDPSSNNLVLAYVLIAVGFLLLVGELFFTSGTLLVLALTSIAAGIGLAFYHGSTTGLFTLLGVMVALPLFGGLLVRYWPKTRFGRRMLLSAPDEDATVAAMPVNLELEQLRGRFGRATSDLRPCGVCDFDGSRVDTITEGMMVEAGHWVRCVDVRHGKVVVRPVEKPHLDDLENVVDLT